MAHYLPLNPNKHIFDCSLRSYSAIFNLTYRPLSARLQQRFPHSFCQRKGGCRCVSITKPIAIVGDHGTLAVLEHDEISRKLAMLIEGECEGLGPSQSRREIRVHQATVLSTPQSLRERRSAGPAE